MKQIRGLPRELAEGLESLGGCTLTLSGRSRLLVEGHRGLLDYGGERVALRADKGKVIVTGSGLRLEAMNARELILAGEILSIQWE